MPKDQRFQNRVTDLCIDENRFIYFPFIYPDDDVQDQDSQNLDNRSNQFGKYSSSFQKSNIIDKLFSPQKQNLNKISSHDLRFENQDERNENKLNLKYCSIVLVFDNYIEKNCGRNSKNFDIEKTLLEISILMFREEVRSGWISQEAYKIIKIKDILKEKSKISINQQNMNDKRNQKLKFIMSESSLAITLSEIFECFKNKKEKNILINNWIPFRVKFANHKQDFQPIQINPKQSLLLYQISQEDLLPKNSLLEISISQDIFNPFMNFKELLDQFQSTLKNYKIIQSLCEQIVNHYQIGKIIWPINLDKTVLQFDKTNWRNNFDFEQKKNISKQFHNSYISYFSQQLQRIDLSFKNEGSSNNFFQQHNGQNFKDNLKIVQFETIMLSLFQNLHYMSINQLVNQHWHTFQYMNIQKKISKTHSLPQYFKRDPSPNQGQVRPFQTNNNQYKNKISSQADLNIKKSQNLQSKKMMIPILFLLQNKILEIKTPILKLLLQSEFLTNKEVQIISHNYIFENLHDYLENFQSTIFENESKNCNVTIERYIYQMKGKITDQKSAKSWYILAIIYPFILDNSERLISVYEIEDLVNHLFYKHNLMVGNVQFHEIMELSQVFPNAITICWI